MSRKRTAWLLTLVLILELAVLCCACAHIACHHCVHSPRCAVCAYVRLGLRAAFLLPAVLLTLIALLSYLERARHQGPACRVLTLFDRRVKLND